MPRMLRRLPAQWLSSHRPLGYSLALPLLLASTAPGCSGGTSTVPPVDDGANTNAACQPIAGKTCFLPFPSAFYEKADSTSDSGYRLNIPVGALPPNQVDTPFKPDRFNQLPGYSLGATMVAEFGVRVDGTKFVGERDDYTLSTKADSLAQIIDYATGERVPCFAEVDANADQPGKEAEVQVVLIHPMVRLKPATRYVVAFQKLVDKTGAKVVVKPFRSLVDGKLADGSRLADVKSRYAEILAATDKAGLQRADLTLAWDFVTGTDKQGWGNMVTIRDAGLARWKADNLGMSVVTLKDVDNDPDLVRSVEGTFQVPSFMLRPDDPFSPASMDANGNPVDSGKNFTANFLIHVPKCALTATGPLPVLIYGHGNFGSRDEINSGIEKQTMNTLCMVMAATEWTGQAEGDDAVFGSWVAQFDKVVGLFDRMEQGQLNTLVLARLAAQKFASMPELQGGASYGALNGKPLVDGKNVYYYGNSQGGIYGDTFMALSPDVQKGVLGVGGANYSLMIWRSRDFDAEKRVTDNLYPDLAQQQALWMLGQTLWDHIDPVGFASHAILDPLPDGNGGKLAPKQILLMEGRYDMQVPNVSSRYVARLLGLPLLTPKIESVYGLEEKAGPLASAYTQWDVHATPPPPPTNTPFDKGDGTPAFKEPQGSTGETVHEAVRRLPDAIEMMRRFLRPDGKVESVCTGTGGACDYPKK